MPTSLTVITENTVVGKGDALYAEHGFSLFLARPERRRTGAADRGRTPRARSLH